MSLQCCDHRERVKTHEGEEERLAPTPNVDVPFVVDAGYVYWRGEHQDHAAVLRRSLVPGAPEQQVAPLPTYDPATAMVVASSRVSGAYRLKRAR